MTLEAYQGLTPALNLTPQLLSARKHRANPGSTPRSPVTTVGACQLLVYCPRVSRPTTKSLVSNSVVCMGLIEKCACCWQYMNNYYFKQQDKQCE